MYVIITYMYISDVEYLASGCHPGFHQEFSSLPGGPFHPCPCRDHHAGRPDDRSPFDRRGDHRGGHRGARNGGRPGDRRGGRRSHHHHHLQRQRWQRLWKDGEVLNTCLSLFFLSDYCEIECTSMMKIDDCHGT